MTKWSTNSVVTPVSSWTAQLPYRVFEVSGMARHRAVCKEERSLYDKIKWFIISTMSPREFLEIWLALNSAIYSQIALFSSLNCIPFPTNEQAKPKQNNHLVFKARFKQSIKLWENQWQNSQCHCSQFCFLLLKHPFRPKKQTNKQTNG